jgi:hypothetical protein
MEVKKLFLITFVLSSLAVSAQQKVKSAGADAEAAEKSRAP